MQRRWNVGLLRNIVVCGPRNQKTPLLPPAPAPEAPAPAPAPEALAPLRPPPPEQVVRVEVVFQSNNQQPAVCDQETGVDQETGIRRRRIQSQFQETGVDQETGLDQETGIRRRRIQRQFQETGVDQETGVRSRRMQRLKHITLLCQRMMEEVGMEEADR
ncbi:hypothetical protein ACFX2F_021769 [Malus domestica]